mgnify:CR=1 FL=1
MRTETINLITSLINKRGKLGWVDSELPIEAIKDSKVALTICYYWAYQLSVEAFAEGVIWSENTPIHFDQLLEYQNLIWNLIQLNPKNP